ncbi:hypothetical protein [Paracraurococcus lichenis]|uniref:Conjugal transfer protein TrbC n=1 Tax=Paracraurococcus lichenis TaxID=3064888 RepID=A0ABT9E8G4_9PROT|nr:hypothetical protein [Paracraurococcus sp. LOR1-02]MDO9712355.1 hypothetical protein [Paracraurococcus sp. LOR1-02]
MTFPSKRITTAILLATTAASPALAQITTGGVNISGNLNPTTVISNGINLLLLVLGALILGYWGVVGAMHLRGNPVEGRWIVGGIIGTCFIAGCAFIGQRLLGGGGVAL